MDTNQDKGSASEETVKTKKVTGKVTHNESTENKDSAKKQGGNAGAVLREVNGSAGKKTK